MAVDINIPGIGVVSANNAAQDSTLNAILSAIQAQTGTTTNVSSAGLSAANQKGSRLAGTLSILGGTASNTGDQIAGAGKSASNAASKFTAASTKVFSSFGMLASQSTTTGGMMGSIGKGITSLGETVSSAVSSFGFVGQKIGGTIAAVSAGLGLLAGVLSKNIEQYEKIQAAGGSFGYSLTRMREISHEAGISVEMMSNIVQKAGHQLSMFGGTTERGARDFAKQNKLMQDTHGDSLLRLGIGYQEQGQYLAEFMGDLAASGANLSELDPTDLNNSFMTLTKQQKMFAQYNGTTLEQERQKAKANKEDAQLQAALLGLAPEQRKAAEMAIAQAETMVAGGGKALKEMFLNNGEVFTAGSVGLVSELGTGFSDSLREIQSGITDKSITNEQEMVTAFDKMGKSFGPEQLKNMAEIVKAGAMGATGPVVDALTGAYTTAERTLNKAVNETLPKIQEDMRKTDFRPEDDPLTQNAIRMAGVIKKFQTEVDKTVDKMVGSNAFNMALDGATKGLREVTEFIKRITADPSEIEEPTTRSGSWTDRLENSIVGAIRDGFNFAFSGAEPADSSTRPPVSRNDMPNAPTPPSQGSAGDDTLDGGAGNDTLNNTSVIPDDVADAIRQTPVLLQQLTEQVRQSSDENARTVVNGSAYN